MMRSIFYLLFFMIMFACKIDRKEKSELNPILEDTVATELEIDTVSTKSESEVIKPARPGWAEITEDEFTKLDLRYATDNNFVEEQMYDCGRCFVREEAYAGLENVRSELKEKGFGIILYDCYRPRPVQQKLWDKVPNASYVTPPSRGSMHNRGVALDIGLTDAKGEVLDMGTEFDYFGKEGHHDYYDHPKEVLENRKLLKSTMEKHAFASIRTEWWHYSYVIGEYDIAEWLWDCQ